LEIVVLRIYDMHNCMNKAAFSFDWNQIRAFLAAVDEQTLSGAARQLGMAQPTVGRQIAGLEADLGVTLFERSRRGLSLTQAGLELVEHVRAMSEAAARISLAASGQAQTIEGQVTISASDGISAHVLPGILSKLRRQVPGITIDLVAANTLSDLQRREADIAIRHVRPEQPELIAKLLRTATANLYATGAFLDRIGRPQTLGDLAEVDFVGFETATLMVEELNRRGLPITAENFKVSSNNGVVYLELVKASVGVGIMVDNFAWLEPGLELACPGFEPFEFPIWLVTHRELQTSRRIRLVYDFLDRELRQAFGSSAGAPP
jgi:DNA-binding transcriptional LysR family regulator